MTDEKKDLNAEGRSGLEIEEITWELEDSSAPAKEPEPKAAAEPAPEEAAPALTLDAGAPEEEPYAPSGAALDPFAAPGAPEPESGYEEQPAYEPEPAYEEQPAYEAEPPSGPDSYQAEPAYEPEPEYAPEQEPVYEAEPLVEVETPEVTLSEAEATAYPEEPAEEPAAEHEPEQYDYTGLWGWRQSASGFTPFIFESDKTLHRFSPGRIDLVEDVGAMGRYFTYLVDFADAPGMGLLTLSTEMKYAPVLARKNLEEIGELSTDGILKIFAKRKLEGGQVSAFYEVLPRDRYAGISEAYQAFAPGFIIFDTVSLLHSLLKRVRGGVGAVALHLPGAILMLAGKSGQVNLARRYTLIGDDEQALTEGIFALEQDLTALQKNLGQKIPQVEWIEALTPTLNLARPDVEIPIVAWPVHMLTLNGERMWSALPSAIRRASSLDALGPKEELFLRPLEGLEKFVWVVFLALCIVAGLLFFQVNSARQGLDAHIQALSRQNQMAEQDIRSRAVELSAQDVEPALNLAREFNLAAVSPPFGEMWNYLASLRPASIRVDALEFAYQQDSLGVRLEGEVEMELTRAQQLFNGFLGTLEKNGFKIDSQQLDLGLEGNYYTLNVRWPLQKEGE
ncbi:MAG: hypothetical protein AB1916_12065 [Thermodesulfobacteriota bacterium]